MTGDWGDTGPTSTTAVAIGTGAQMQRLVDIFPSTTFGIYPVK